MPKKILKPLTDLAIKKIRLRPDGRFEVADGGCTGLVLRVSQTGVKSFVVRTRVVGRMVRVTIGRYPEMSLSEARSEALRVLAEAKQGVWPKAKQSRVETVFKFETVVEEYIQTHCHRFMKQRTLDETKRILSVEFVSLWGDRDLRKISKTDVVAVTNEIFNRKQFDKQHGVAKDESPSAANHAHADIRAFFNWCVGQGKLEATPCVGLRSPAPKRKRDRTLNDEELVAVWHAASEIGYPYGNIIQLLIVTVQRRGEVAGLRWEMLVLDELLWRVPASDNKSGREYLVPLPALAVNIIETIPQIDDKLMFPAQRSDGKVFADWSKSKKRIDEISGVTNWTVHDLRRTGSTNLAKLGVAPHVKERVLNHLTGELGGIAGVYDVYSYLPEKRAALDLWAAHLQRLVG